MEKATGIPHSTFSFYENGRRWPTPEHAEKLADYYGWDVRDLQQAVSPSVLASLWEIERLLRLLVPEQLVEDAPHLAPLKKEQKRLKPKASRAKKTAAQEQ